MFSSHPYCPHWLTVNTQFIRAVPWTVTLEDLFGMTHRTAAAKRPFYKDLYFISLQLLAAQRLTFEGLIVVIFTHEQHRTVC